MNGHIRLADFGSCLKLMEDGTVRFFLFFIFFYHSAADASSSGPKQTYQSFTDLLVNPQGSPRSSVCGSAVWLCLQFMIQAILLEKKKTTFFFLFKES